MCASTMSSEAATCCERESARESTSVASHDSANRGAASYGDEPEAAGLLGACLLRACAREQRGPVLLL